MPDTYNNKCCPLLGIATASSLTLSSNPHLTSQLFKRLTDLSALMLNLQWIPISYCIKSNSFTWHSKACMTQLHRPPYPSVPHSSLGTLECLQFLKHIIYFYFHNLEILLPLSLKNSIFQGSLKTLTSPQK